jgi:predicted TIM-barrel fold metal-dependent hydrolase
MARFHPIDADGHVMEPDDVWLRFLEPALHPMAPRRVTDSQGRMRHLVAGELKPPIPAPSTGWDLPAGGHDPAARLEDMDHQGIGRSLLFPTTALYFAPTRDLEVYRALCRAYNDWLHTFCAADPERLLGVAVVPQSDVSESIVEAKRAVRELGFRAVMLRPNPIAGRTLEDPWFEPLWTTLEELEVPLALHEGTTQDVPQSGRERFDNFLFRHACSHPHEQQMACLSLTCGGVLERHPGLRVVFLESGCGWIAHWLERLDEHMTSWSFASAPLPLAPSEYFRRQCFITAEPGERTLPAMVELLGDQSFLFATDYPHPDALADGVVEKVSGLERLPEESRARILYGNAERCLGLVPGATP